MASSTDFLDMFYGYLDVARLHVNDHFRGLEPWQIVAYSTAWTLLAVWLWDFLHQDESLFIRAKNCTFRTMKRIPFIRKKIDAELGSTLEILEKDMIQKSNKGLKFYQTLPAKGLTEKQVMAEIDKYKRMEEIDVMKGRVSGTVYGGVGGTLDLAAKVYAEFIDANPLHPDVFPDTRKMEAEIVRMTCNMFKGGPQSCGTVTSGGTESLLLCCLAYRNLALENGIKKPEIIAPTTAHAGFDKAAYLFRMKLTHIPIDPVTCKVDVRKMKRAINSNTCMLVGSAPPFPHGIVDPIDEIGQLGLKYGIPVHVDACLGGFVVAFMEKAGYYVPPFDFRVPGVTSISADTHKYGYAPKGSSVICYSDNKYRRKQFFCAPDWPGGIYASPTLAGSRAGALIACCWASMMFTGEDGYVNWTKKLVSTARHIEAGLRAMDGLMIRGKPEVTVVAVGSDVFNIYRLSDALSERGWNLNILQYPPGFHICVTQLWTQQGVADKFLADARECVTEIMKDPKKEASGVGAIYGMSQQIPDRTLVHEMAAGFLELCYSTKDGPVADGNTQNQ